MGIIVSFHTFLLHRLPVHKKKRIALMTTIHFSRIVDSNIITIYCNITISSIKRSLGIKTITIIMRQTRGTIVPHTCKKLSIGVILGNKNRFCLCIICFICLSRNYIKISVRIACNIAKNRGFLLQCNRLFDRLSIFCLHNYNVAFGIICNAHIALIIQKLRAIRYAIPVRIRSFCSCNIVLLICFLYLKCCCFRTYHGGHQNSTDCQTCNTSHPCIFSHFSFPFHSAS